VISSLRCLQKITAREGNQNLRHGGVVNATYPYMVFGSFMRNGTCFLADNCTSRNPCIPKLVAV